MGASGCDATGRRSSGKVYDELRGKQERALIEEQIKAAHWNAPIINEMWPFIVRWASVLRLKKFGHPDPIGEMDLYSFDMICEIDSVAERLQIEKIKGGEK